MIDFWKSLAGIYEVELTTAAPEERLWEINEQEIPVYQVNYISDLCIRFRIRRKDIHKLKKICEIRGDTLLIRKQLGLYSILSAARKRPVLLVGICFLLLMTFLLPTRVLFLRVEGNVRVPENQILEAASQCGLRFGSHRRSIRSEQIKNELLGYIPELKWAGINTYGCVAVISVREASGPENQDAHIGVSNIVALRDGVVLNCTATKGNLLCKPGEVVREGQILISGYTDCGQIIQATNAQGEVFAQTLRDVRVTKLLQSKSRGEKREEHRRVSVIVGKKRINLWKDSGIWDATCGRMYQEYVLSLPGGFRLPVALCVETFTHCELTEQDCSEEDVSGQLGAYAEEYLLGQMISGRIRTGSFHISQKDGVATLEGNYICTEMIGRIQPEQIGEEDGKTN